jgi:hypothetical protein
MTAMKEFFFYHLRYRKGNIFENKNKIYAFDLSVNKKADGSLPFCVETAAVPLTFCLCS